MPIFVQCEPAQLDFGAVAPGTTTTSKEVQIAAVPAAAQVTAAVVDGAQYFTVDWVAAYTVTSQPVDPGELPPGHHGPRPREQVYELTGRSDGRTPLRVQQGQVVQVVVRVTAPAAPTSDTLSGSLRVLGDTWAPVDVPLRMLLRAYRVTLRSTRLTVVQGQSCAVGADVTSVAGPDTVVTFSLVGDGFSLGANTLQLPRGTTRSRILTLRAAPETSVGEHTLPRWMAILAGVDRLGHAGVEPERARCTSVVSRPGHRGAVV